MPAAPTAREEEHVTVESVQGNADRSGNAHDPRGVAPSCSSRRTHRAPSVRRVPQDTTEHLCWKHEARALLAAAGGPRMHSGDEPPGGASSSGARGPTTGLGPTEAQGCSDPLTCTRDPSTRSPSAGLRRGPDPLARTPAARAAPQRIHLLQAHRSRGEELGRSLRYTGSTYTGEKKNFVFYR